MHTKTQIMEMIQEMTGGPVSSGAQTHLCRHLGVDSLSFVRLLLQIEVRYAIVFEIPEMEQCLQLDRLVSMVRMKVKEREGNCDSNGIVGSGKPEKDGGD